MLARSLLSSRMLFARVTTLFAMVWVVACFDAVPPIDLEAPSVISCAGANECPADLTCFAQFQRCVPSDTPCMNTDGTTVSDGNECLGGNICLAGLCIPPRCGDGITTDSAGEACDDGNDRNDDRCVAGCVLAICGDKYVRLGVESCDPGDDVEDDCTDTCGPSTCGNGVVDPGEACDDRENVQDVRNNGNLCLNTCQFNSCGDGYVNAGIEACDDGNDIDNDACRNRCGDPSCGDGVFSPEREECDDNNAVLSDDCLPSCLLSTCGDGVRFIGNLPGEDTLRDEAAEDCDDGNNDATDGCNACVFPRCGDGVVQPALERCDFALVDAGAAACTTSCALVSCGDGNVDAGEECDDGNRDPFDDCLPSCQQNTCHDGVINLVREACDDGNVLNNDACVDACVRASCGDPYVNLLAESCDDGNSNDADGCNNDCGAATCGDGNLDAPLEECDDGNRNNDDACLASCRVARCGDGVIQAGPSVEECDDGNGNNADACRNDCRLPICGDGFLQPGEDCEPDLDENCPGTCVIPVCGNGAVEAPELCDDQNEVTTDACNFCVPNVCNDGIIRLTGDPLTDEECDDGPDGNNDDGCTEACRLPRCGDGFVYAAYEVCDAGGVSGAGCADDCLSVQ
jgi:cysteine-rich repeat protein